MKRSATKHTKKAIALTNPNPSFVSLVRAGANMTPFLAVKSAEGNAQEAPMKVKKSDTHDIAGITFKSASFADEAAVQAWLTAGGYEDTAITKKGDDFYVAGVDGLSDVKSVEADGVVIETGKREAAVVVTEKTEEDKAKEAEAASGIVQVVKSDEAETLLGSSVLPATVEITADKSVQLGEVVALAHKTSGLSIADWNAQKDEDREAALVAAVDAMKAEAAAAVEATKTEAEAGATVALTDAEVLAKAVKQIEALASTGIQFKTQKGVYTVSDIGYVLNELRYMIESDYNGLSDEARATVKAAAQAMITVLVEAMQTTIDGYVETFKAEAEATAKAAAEAEAQVTTAKADETETPDPLAALMLRMEQMETKVTELTTENTTLKSEKSVSEERVKSLEEDQRQTRKSADAAEAAAATTQTDTSTQKTTSDSDFVAERRKKSMLGIS